MGGLEGWRGGGGGEKKKQSQRVLHVTTDHGGDVKFRRDRARYRVFLNLTKNFSPLNQTLAKLREKTAKQGK